MEAYAALRSRLVTMPLLVVGRPGWLYEGIYERHERLGLGDSVRFLTDVEDQDLAVLYRHAHVTICAALYEGFGLPTLEALASGAPVACSGNTSMPDVAGEAACYFDPWDVEDMVETILGLVESEDLRQRLRVSGPIRAREFNWTRAAEATSHLYHQIIAN
jgi:glycosyltransferase involved in cell wall biosynthesis